MALEFDIHRMAGEVLSFLSSHIRFVLTFPNPYGDIYNVKECLDLFPST